MTKKNIFLLLAVVLLGVLSYSLNKDRFRSESTQISHRSIPPRGAQRPGAKNPANTVVFLANKKLKLTSVKVVLVSDAATNKYPHSIWTLVSDSNSVPVKQFVYGALIPGMRLAVKGVGADPLQPGENYRLLIEASAEKAQHDFVPVARTR
jgi:hypothetical protein